MTEPKPLRVLIVSQHFTGGGLERIVHLLSKTLIEEYHCEIIRFSFDNEADPALKVQLESYGIKCVHVKKSPGFSFKTILEIIKIIKDEKIDVIHTHETAPLMYSAIAKLLTFYRVRLVHTQHSFIHLDTRSMIRHYDRIFQKFANHVTAVSSSLKEKYLNLGLKTERILVVPNGIEFSDRPETEDARALLRIRLLDMQKGLCFPKPEAEWSSLKWLVNLSRVHPRKGQDHLIRVWAKLTEETRKSSLLIFIGPETQPGEAARLKAIIQNEGIPHSHHIVFAGNTQEPVTWLAAADLFLSASEYEGMPLSPIEAAGTGIPLVLSDIDGHRFLDGKAKLFQFTNPAAGASAVEHWLKLERTDFSLFQKSLELQSKQIREHFSLKSMAEVYFNLYQKD